LHAPSSSALQITAAAMSARKDRLADLRPLAGMCINPT